MSPLTLLYAVAVGALLTGAAALAESALRTRLRAARWVWGFALVATAAAPVWGPRLATAGGALGGAEASFVQLPGGGFEVTLVDQAGAQTLGARASEALRALARPLDEVGLAWLVLSALAAGWLGLSLARLSGRVRRLPRARIGGDEVRLAPDFGPACVGLAQRRIVLPQWILGLERADLDLVLRHERAHADARDPLLLALGYAAVAVAPWNPLLWWQASRLRRAVELDCDARVLASGAPRAAYGRVLVKVLSRVRTGPLPAPALLDPVSFLERRLTLMRRSRPGPWTRTLGAGALAGAFAILACETPAPSPVGPTPEVERAEATDETAAELATSFRVEGIGALPANATLVVDGVIVRNDALDEFEIPVDEIASVEIVKSGERPVVSIRTKPAVVPSGAVRMEGAETVRYTIRQEGTVPGEVPIVYLDGELVEGGMSAVQELIGNDPARIESVEVVKGEAARLIVGEAGKNGVIRITTKKPGG